MALYGNIIQIFLLLFFSSCMVGPKYQKPHVQIPAVYKQTQNNQSEVAIADWWQTYNDPYLYELIKKALMQNYDLHIALEKIEQARAFYRIQEAELFPEVNVHGTISRSQFSKNTNKGSILSKNTLSYFQAGFDALWELDIWGKLRHAKNAAYDTFQAQIEYMHDVHIILVSDVAKTYIQCRSLQKKIDLLNQQIVVDTMFLDLLKDQFYSGLASSITSAEQLVLLQESKNQLIVFTSLFKQSVNSLAILLGQNPEDFSLQFGLHVVPTSQKIPMVGLPSDLLRRRPDIRKAERLLAAATENVEQARADWFPSFSLLGSVDLETNNTNNWFTGNSLSWSIGPSVKWPIITFGRISYNIKEKKSVQRQAFLVYGQSVIQALNDVENSLIAYFNGGEVVKVLEEKVAAVSQVYSLTKSLFKSGLRDKLEVLSSAKNRILAELDLTDAQMAFSISHVSLYKALGGDW